MPHHTRATRWLRPCRKAAYSNFLRGQGHGRRQHELLRVNKRTWMLCYLLRACESSGGEVGSVEDKMLLAWHFVEHQMCIACSWLCPSPLEKTHRDDRDVPTPPSCQSLTDTKLSCSSKQEKTHTTTTATHRPASWTQRRGLRSY
jgi:hypothetical protein